MKICNSFVKNYRFFTGQSHDYTSAFASGLASAAIILCVLLSSSVLYAQQAIARSVQTVTARPVQCMERTSTNEQFYNCFTVIAGKNATADGSVLMAHNEDDHGEQLVNIYLVPKNGQNGTPKYLWLEAPGMEASDSFLNEYGVAIVSDMCPSKEDKPVITDGGILYQLRVQAAKKARTAREAIGVMGSMIDKYGYRSTGRSYMVADPKEGWILSVVNGKHWVAARIPDDKVMIIPNNYVIDKINLADTVNFAGSRDIIEYAIARGWYSPEQDGDFSFKKAYGTKDDYLADANVWRHLSALNYFSGKNNSSNPDSFPFVFVPYKKVTVEDMFNVMRSHGENTNFAQEIKDRYKGKHPKNICNNSTIYSVVYQLRGGMPVEKGAIAWTAIYHPCASVYHPLTLAMKKSPKGFTRYSTAEEAEANHFSQTKGMEELWPDMEYWKYVKKFQSINNDY